MTEDESIDTKEQEKLQAQLEAVEVGGEEEAEEEEPMRFPADYDLLYDTLSVQSASRDDLDMMNFILKKLGEIQKETGAQFGATLDDYKNLYVIKGEPESGHAYPVVVCHVDTVHDRKKHYRVMEANGMFFAMDMYSVRQAGVGGDDKVGVYVCLEALRHLPYVKVVFFRDEEIGCLGSKQADMEFFKNVSFVIQADRKGGTDFIEHSNGVKIWSDIFHDTAKPLLERFGYKRCHGISTDAGQLVVNGLGVSAVNISAGYYNPHTSGEFVVFEDVEVAMNLALEMCSTMTEWFWVWTPPKPEPRKYNYQQWNGGSNLGNSLGSQAQSGKSGSSAGSENKSQNGNDGAIGSRLPGWSAADEDDDDEYLYWGSYGGSYGTIKREKGDIPGSEFDGGCIICASSNIKYYEAGYFCFRCGSFFDYDGVRLSPDQYSGLGKNGVNNDNRLRTHIDTDDEGPFGPDSASDVRAEGRVPNPILVLS